MPSEPALMRICEVFLLTELIGDFTLPLPGLFLGFVTFFPLHMTDNKMAMHAGSCFPNYAALRRPR